MINRRTLIAASTCLAATLLSSPVFAAAPPAATLDHFYAVLLSVMKDGKKLGFAGRSDKLAPAIHQAFDLPAMTRLVIGPQWPSFSPAEQNELLTAFGNYSIATYASQFNDYSGEKFEVEPKAVPAPGGDVIVKTKLVQAHGQPVELNYLMHDARGSWRILDVYLSGTISQLAVRRSEFSSVLRDHGVAALVDLLKQKTAQLANG